MMAPEPEFDLATSRSRVNQDPATLSRPELRFGNYLPLLGQSGRKLLEEAAAPAPEAGELDLATERGRLGGRTGFNFGSGTLYTQNRFDNRRHLLEAHDDHDDHDDHDHDHEAEAEPAAAVVDGEMASMMMMAAPEPEMDLATSRARVNQDPATLSRAELRFGNYLPLLGQSGRKLLDSEEEAEDMEEMMAPASYDARRRQLLSEDAAPAPEDEAELVMSTERGRLGGRTGVNLRTGTLYTQNRFDDRRRRQLLGEEMESEMMMAPEPEMDLAT